LFGGHGGDRSEVTGAPLIEIQDVGIDRLEMAPGGAASPVNAEIHFGPDCF
jgi:hypothetical protein